MERRKRPKGGQTLGVRQQVPVWPAAVRHRPEFIGDERSTFVAGALLEEQDGGAEENPDQQANDQKKRQENNQAEHGHQQVENPF